MVSGHSTADDPNGVFAGVDLSMPEIQHRLVLIAEKHENERRIAVAWMKRHGTAASHKDVLAGATQYVRKQLVRWGPHLEEHELAVSRQAEVATASTRPASVNTATYERELPVGGINLTKSLIRHFRGPNAPVSPTPAHRQDLDAVGMNRLVNAAIQTVRVALGADSRPNEELEPEVPQFASSAATREASPVAEVPAPPPRAPSQAYFDPAPRSVHDNGDKTSTTDREKAVATQTATPRPPLRPGNFSLER